MPDEVLIAEIESTLSQVVSLGAEKERTRMVPNLLIRNSAPGPAGFILVRDDRDGDNILARKVPSVIYNTNDFVNVLFVQGGEAIAFQQGSESASSDIWGIVSGTSTDIFYNSGDVGIGKSVAPDATLEVLDTTQAQLRLTHTEDSKFIDFTLDTNHDLTVKPSSNGQVIFQPTTDSVDFFQVRDADGGTPVLNVDSINERIGVGNAAPTTTLDVTGTVTITDDILHAGDTDTKIAFTDDDIEFTAGALSMLKLTEAAQDLIKLGPGSGDIDFDFNGDGFLEGSSGKWIFGATTVGNDKVAFQGDTGTFINVGFYAGDGDGTDSVSLIMYGVGTPGSTANRERLLVQFEQAANVFRFQTEAAGTGTVRPLIFETEGNSNQIYLATDGDVGIGTASPAAQLDVDQASTTAAQPVLLLDQADISEEMRQFETTIGTGNAIEAAGLKVLTVTHYVKDTLPGGLTRYTPYGTISTTGPKFTKNEMVTTQGLGANPDVFAFGFYEFSATDANLTQASTTQTFGTANVSYAAHAFAVTGGAGSTDAGVVGLRVNGTSINDQGTRTPGDTETIIADITAAALDDYQETDKKWLGTVTYELFTVSGSPTTFSLDFNYGFAKYDDWFNTDFTITDIEAMGFAGANDSDFDIKLMHHQSSGWTYSAAAFTPITAANTVASLVTDHSTDDQLASSQHMAWKRNNLSEVINGDNGEGFLVFVSSSANNSIEYLNIDIGVVF